MHIVCSDVIRVYRLFESPHTPNNHIRLGVVALLREFEIELLHLIKYISSEEAHETKLKVLHRSESAKNRPKL